MPWWDNILMEFESDQDDGDGLLVGHGRRLHAAASRWINELIDCMREGGPAGEKITATYLAELVGMDRPEINRMAKRRNVDLVTPLIALEAEPARRDYLATCVTRAKSGDMRKTNFEKGPIGVHNGHEALAGWALVPGDKAIHDVAWETFGPILKDTVDDPLHARELRDRGEMTYTPEHGLPIEPSDLLFGQLRRIAAAEDAARRYAGEEGPKRSTWHRELPTLWGEMPYGFVKEHAYSPSGTWYPGLDRSFLEELSLQPRGSLWAAYAFGAAAVERGEAALDSLTEARPPYRRGAQLAEAAIAELERQIDDALSEERPAPRLSRFRGVLIHGAPFDLIVHAGDPHGGGYATAWTIPCETSRDDDQRLRWCLWRHRASPDAGALGFEAAVKHLAEQYGVLRPQPKTDSMRAFVRSVMLAANARRVADQQR